MLQYLHFSRDQSPVLKVGGSEDSDIDPEIGED